MCLSLQVAFLWKDPLLVCVMFLEFMLVGTLNGIFILSLYLLCCLGGAVLQGREREVGKGQLGYFLLEFDICQVDLILI